MIRVSAPPPRLTKPPIRLNGLILDESFSGGILTAAGFGFSHPVCVAAGTIWLVSQKLASFVAIELPIVWSLSYSLRYRQRVCCSAVMCRLSCRADEVI